MKYLIFFLFSFVSVPVMTWLSMSSKKLSTILFGMAIISIAFGDAGNINFLSMENYRGPDRGFEVSITDLIFIALLLNLLIKHFKKIRWLPFNTIPSLAFVVICIISGVLSLSPLLSAFSIFKLFRVFLLYFVTYNFISINKDCRAIWYSLVTLGVMFAFIGFKQKYINGIYRIPGPFDHSNTIPLFLNQIFPIIFIWTLADKSISNVKSAVAFFAGFGMIFCIAATFSRAGIGLAFACLMSVIFYSVFRAPGLKTTLSSILIVMLIFAGGIKLSDSLLDRIRNAPKSSEKARDEFNLAASLMSQDYFLGVGPNNFSLAMTKNEKYRAFLEAMKGEEQAGVCHHLYWLTAAEMGFPGLVFLLAIFIRFLWIALYNSVKFKNLNGAICFGILVGACSLHVSGFLEWAFRLTPVIFIFSVLSAFLASLNENPDIVSQLVLSEEKQC